MEKKDQITQGRLLTVKEVREMWPVSRSFLWELSTTKDESRRLPSYKVGRHRLYKYDELMWYLDKHKAA
jgi:Helix-turn-helix domain